MVEGLLCSTSLSVEAPDNSVKSLPQTFFLSTFAFIPQREFSS